MLKAGIIGCGGITERRHGPVLVSMSDRVNIAALADLSTERSALMGDKLDVSADHCYADWQKMLENEELDFVHICTPHHLHAPQAIAAMQAGAHVLLEKPMATTLADIDRMIEVAQTTGRKLAVGHNQLFSAGHRAAVQQIRAGAVGRIFLVRSESFSRSHVVGRGVEQHWRTQSKTAGGGPLIDNGYHEIYRAVDYVDSPAARVFARIDRHVQAIEVEDTALLLIEHESGATTSLQVGWSAPVGGIAVKEILGTKGQIRFGGEPPLAVWRQTTEAWEHPPVDPEGPDELGFPLVVEHFVRAIETDGLVPVSGEDARHILAIVLAAYKSGRSGLPVEL